MGKIADHKGLMLTLPLSVPRIEVQARTVWQFKAADWDGLRTSLLQQVWAWLSQVHPDEGATRLTSIILELAGQFIPRRRLQEQKSTHPWISERVLVVVRKKIEDEGTEREEESRKRCSVVIREEYGKYIAREREALQRLPNGAKCQGVVEQIEASHAEKRRRLEHTRFERLM